jgi:hypothetical protein
MFALGSHLDHIAGNQHGPGAVEIKNIVEEA